MRKGSTITLKLRTGGESDMDDPMQYEVVTIQTPAGGLHPHDLRVGDILDHKTLQALTGGVHAYKVTK